MEFLGVFLQLFIKFLFFLALAVAGIYTGKKLRDHKTAKDGK